MNFCPQCETILTKKPTNDNKIIFVCKCSLTIEGTAADTLMYHRTNTNKGAKHQVMIENAPYDDAGNKVFISCKKCMLPFTTKVLLVDVGVTYYTCSCGFIVSHQDYENK